MLEALEKGNVQNLIYNYENQQVFVSINDYFHLIICVPSTEMLKNEHSRMKTHTTFLPIFFYGEAVFVHF